MPAHSRPILHASPRTSQPHQCSAKGSKMNPSPAAITDSLGDPAANFKCTICWQDNFPPSTPKLLGTSSRIVCQPCFKAVLDLSICWVCGECIVRGDEVVSLGWCFWHLACFGCLVCGTRMSLEGDKGAGEWGKWDGGLDESGEWKGRKRRIGIELDTIPLCAACGVETEGENDKRILKRGLDTVSRLDGGLSRNRLDMLTLEEDERRTERSRWKPPRRYKGSSGLERDLKKFINGSSGSSNGWSECIHAEDLEDRSPLVDNAQAMGISEDGNADDDEDHYHSDEEIAAHEHHEERGNDVYLSVFNPTGEAAFKPSKTKPLPKWMALLPSNVQKEGEQHKVDEAESNPPQRELESLGDSAEHNDSPAPPRQSDLTQFSDDDSTPTALSRVPTAAGPPDKHFRRQLTISICEEPKKEHAYNDPGSRARRSQTVESSSPSLPDQPSSIPVRQKTPYPGNQPLSMTIKSTGAEASSSIPISREPCSDMTKELFGSPADSKRFSRISSVKEDLAANYAFSCADLSSEYVERYQPKVVDSKCRKYEAKVVEPILEKIKRQKIGKQNMAQVAEEKSEERRKGKGKASKCTRVEDEEYGLDPRREDLKRELRNLFCEE